MRLGQSVSAVVAAYKNESEREGEREKNIERK